MIDGRTWTDDNGFHLVAEPLFPADDTVMVSVYDRSGDGPSVRLSPTQVRELIADLTARVDLISRPAPHGTNWDGEPF